MGATFDTLAFTKALNEAGLPKEYSDAISRAIQDVAMREVATKYDIEALRHSLTVRLGAMIGAAVAILGVLISLH